MTRRIHPATFLLFLLAAVPGCGTSAADDHPHEESHEHHHKIIVTRPVSNDVTITEQYVCQVHSCRHIEVCALESGYIQEIPVNEGQQVRKGDLLFKIVPTLYKAKYDSEAAEAELARLEFNNTKKLFEQDVVSDREVAISQAKLSKAIAQMELAKAELDFTNVTAPFGGIIDRLHHQQGSLVDEGEMLTTLSDNHLLWIYFNVPEARYLEYNADVAKGEVEPTIALRLANGEMFDQVGKIAAIEADFDNETGNIAFRADFPNPNGLLRHGQTGTVMIHHQLEGAIVIPQRATFEILAKRYVFIVDEEGVVHQHEINVKHELEDIYVVDGSLNETDKIVLEGVRQVRDGEKTEYEFTDPEVVLANLKYQAE